MKMVRVNVWLTILAVVVVVVATLAECSMSATPRTLRPVQKVRSTKPLSAVAANLTDMDCNGQLSSCADCTSVLNCTKLGGVYLPLTTAACPTSTPYCVSGQCVADSPDDESCNGAADYTTDFACNGDGYFPSPSSCKKYYLCVGGKAYEYDCSAYTNTVYSHAKAMCVPSTEVKCTAATCSTAKIGQYQLWSQDNSVYVVCTTTDPADAYVADCGADKQIDSATGNCVMACHREGRLAHPTSSSRYYECIQTATSTFSSPIPKWCPSNSTFSAEEERCVASVDETYRLPEGLLIGAATSAYQTEGAWDVDGKGVNNFDYYYHTNNVAQDETGDIAADSYNRYKEDIALAVKYGFTTLRISISWARIFPDGNSSATPNAKGVQHYHDVLKEMKKYKITPLVSMFHFDYPQTFQDQFNAWLGREMIDEFAKYADFLFGEFTEVKYWLTMNEAYMYCNLAGGTVPPGYVQTDEEKKTCLHYLILGHAKAYKVYQKKYQHLRGLVGFGVGPSFTRPGTDSDADVAAAEAKNLGDGGIGCSLEPFYTGDYPEACKSSDRQNFTSEEQEMLLGSNDFAGVNVYGGSTVNTNGGGDDSQSTAWVMRLIPQWINARYDNLPVFFSEFGTTTGTDIDDWEERAVFCSENYRELVYGINVDNNNVIGATIWSLIDSFEFGTYTKGYGLVAIDYEGKTLNRTPKTSMSFFQEMMSSKVVPLVTSSTSTTK